MSEILHENVSIADAPRRRRELAAAGWAIVSEQYASSIPLTRPKLGADGLYWYEFYFDAGYRLSYRKDATCST